MEIKQIFLSKIVCRDQRIALVAALNVIATVGYGKLPGWNREDLQESLVEMGILKKSINHPDCFEAKNNLAKTLLLSLNERSAHIN